MLGSLAEGDANNGITIRAVDHIFRVIETLAENARTAALLASENEDEGRRPQYATPLEEQLAGTRYAVTLSYLEVSAMRTTAEATLRDAHVRNVCASSSRTEH
jgi:hypothetical protein